jgi:hypothetical protein
MRGTTPAAKPDAYVVNMAGRQARCRD